MATWNWWDKYKAKGTPEEHFKDIRKRLDEHGARMDRKFDIGLGNWDSGDLTAGDKEMGVSQEALVTKNDVISVEITNITKLDLDVLRNHNGRLRTRASQAEAKSTEYERERNAAILQIGQMSVKNRELEREVAKLRARAKRDKKRRAR